MEPRIRPTDHEKYNVGGERVPPAEKPKSEPTIEYAETPAQIPEQPGQEDALDNGLLREQLTPTYDTDSTTPDTLKRPSGAKRWFGRAALTLAGFGAATAAIMGIKGSLIERAPGGEVVATSVPFPTTTPQKGVAPPPRYEAPTTTPESQQWNTVYNLRGEPKTLEQMRNEDFTITKQEAPSVELATKNLETVLKSVGNFGIKETNLGVTGDSEEKMAKYNNKQLLETDLLENTGLTKSGAYDLNLLRILVSQNAQNINNRTYTKVEISDIQRGSTASMNGESTTSATATLTLSQPQLGANSSLEKKSYIFTWYVSDKGGDNWEPVKGSIGLRPLN